MAVVIFWPEGTDRSKDDPAVYGPFPDGNAACRWANRKLGAASRWYWMPLQQPSA